jgi:hypothetical protein
MSLGNLEEIIDDNHAIVSTSVGSEHMSARYEKTYILNICWYGLSSLTFPVWELYAPAGIARQIIETPSPHHVTVYIPVSPGQSAPVYIYMMEQ